MHARCQQSGAEQLLQRRAHDGESLLAGTALSQPGQAVSQRRRAGRSPWPPMMEQL
eukprot:COSAG01_NODE_51086_length_357_cov_3.255814_1_plen_55_part_10